MSRRVIGDWRFHCSNFLTELLFLQRYTHSGFRVTMDRSSVSTCEINQLHSDDALNSIKEKRSPTYRQFLIHLHQQNKNKSFFICHLNPQPEITKYNHIDTITHTAASNWPPSIHVSRYPALIQGCLPDLFGDFLIALTTEQSSGTIATMVSLLPCHELVGIGLFFLLSVF